MLFILLGVCYVYSFKMKFKHKLSYMLKKNNVLKRISNHMKTFKTLSLTFAIKVKVFFIFHIIEDIFRNHSLSLSIVSQ